MRRDLGDGYELDDDPGRIDREAVHRYLSEESYWAKGRPRGIQDALIENAARVVGLYHDGRQIGFSRTVSDGHVQSYLADVYVLGDRVDTSAAPAKLTSPARALIKVPKFESGTMKRACLRATLPSA